jgi:mannose-6-phosphate isomerase-like protein (cupin superfamily)
MRAFIPAIGIALFVAAAFTGVSAQQAPAPAGAAAGGARAGGPQIVWSPKATKPGDWTPPHKPHTKLADLLAKHKGKADWVETVVDDDTLHADYISAAPGAKTPRRMNADTREWWVVQDGQIRFTIDGQDPNPGVEGVHCSGAVSHDVHAGDGSAIDHHCGSRSTSRVRARCIRST